MSTNFVFVDVSENICKLNPPKNFDKISMSIHAEGGSKQQRTLKTVSYLFCLQKRMSCLYLEVSGEPLLQRRFSSTRSK